jgi:glucans biosynthesis protein C
LTPSSEDIDAPPMARSPMAIAGAEAVSRAPTTRLAFIDNLRWTMIILVLSMHATDTYSPFGNWYFTDRRPAGLATTFGFGVYQNFLQAFFMALLFFVSGHFAAPALQRRGAVRFARDRFVRLGLPTLLYMLVIGPLTQYFLSHTWGTGGFAHQWLVHLRDGQWAANSGPMWFCAALLALSWIYALVGRPSRVADDSLPLGGRAIAGFVLTMAITTFAVRIAIPRGVTVLNMHPGDFPQYALMFAAGTLAWRRRWLERVPDALGVRAFAWCLGLSLPLLATLVVLTVRLGGRLHGEDGGLTALSALRSSWETLVCVGMSFGLLVLYRKRFNTQGRLARLLSDNAFAVYLFHPPVIIILAMLLRPVMAPPAVMAALLTLLAAMATYALSAAVLRRTPVLKDIL